MNKKSFRTAVVLLCSVLLISLYNCRQVYADSRIRSVDMLSLVGLGMAIGGLLFCTTLFFRRWKAGA